MKGVEHPPSRREWTTRSLHGPALAGSLAEREEPRGEGAFVNRPCYEFNVALHSTLDDAHCRHCRHYLTARCPHIEEFLDDVEDLEPE